jgi:2-oxoglutarate dehydrogenase E2 component (dihydrolipoamide succinyltransferase)
MLSTPIINPPQSAILGMHATKDRPVVENGQIVIRPINYLAMSYDHRIIDGREAVLGLVTMKEALEDPARLLFDVSDCMLTSARRPERGPGGAPDQDCFFFRSN